MSVKTKHRKAWRKDGRKDGHNHHEAIGRQGASRGEREVQFVRLVRLAKAKQRKACRKDGRKDGQHHHGAMGKQGASKGRGDDAGAGWIRFMIDTTTSVMAIALLIALDMSDICLLSGVIQKVLKPFWLV